MINYNDKKFKLAVQAKNGELSSAMIFHYKQEGNILSCAYQDEQVQSGHLIGIVDDAGNIDIRYHQINKDGNLMTGICFSIPEIMENGKIRLHEKWQWTSGDQSKGESVLEEV